MRTIKAYRRSNGAIGIRNQVLVMSLVHCANSTANKIASTCGVPAITIDTGCGEFKEDENRTNLGLIRAGQHPNVYGVLLISLGCQWTDPDYIAGEISKTGTKVMHLCIQKEGGVSSTVKKGSDIVNEMLAEGATMEREEVPVSQLRLSVYCGGSDWSSSLSANPVVGECMDLFADQGAAYVSSPIRGMPGGEQHLTRLAKDDKIGERILEISNEYRNEILNATGQSISDVNPTPGNKANGMTTLREKAISNLKLSGNRTPLNGILQLGEPIPGPGFWIIDNRKGSNDIYACTALAMAGAHVCLFTTGQGTPMGIAGTVTVKVTANPKTYAALGQEIIDFDASAVITQSKSIEEVAAGLFEEVIEIINGKPAKSEILGDSSWVTPPCGTI